MAYQLRVRKYAPRPRPTSADERQWRHFVSEELRQLTVTVNRLADAVEELQKENPTS